MSEQLSWEALMVESYPCPACQGPTAREGRVRACAVCGWESESPDCRRRRRRKRITLDVRGPVAARVSRGASAGLTSAAAPRPALRSPWLAQ